jgi:hypothetical protein
MFDEAAWNDALVKRGEEADRKFQALEKTTQEDVIIMAMLHPDKFDILVQMKGGE